MTASLLPNGKQQFIDANGNPLAGGSVYFYIPNTTTPKDTWQDSAQTILNTNPVVLDSSGQALIYGSGNYRQVVKDAGANLIWDQKVASVTSFDLVIDEDDMASDSDTKVPTQQSVKAYVDGHVTFSDLTAASAFAPVAAPDFIRTAGYAAAGDGGGALYKLNGATTGDLVITLSDGTTKAGYDLAERVVRPQMFGASGDGTDQSAALAAWASHPCLHKVAEAGIYVSSSEMSFPVNSNVVLSSQAIFNLSGSGQFNCVSSFRTLPSLSADVSAGDRLVTFSSAHGLSAGDIVRLASTVDYSWAGFRAEYRAGEDVVVFEVSSTTEIVIAPLKYSYAANDMDCLAFKNESFAIEGGQISKDSGIAILAGCLVRPSVRPASLILSGTAISGVLADRCFEPKITLTGRNDATPNSGNYIVDLANCTDSRIYGDGGHSLWEPLGIGGADSVGAIPTRGTRVFDMHLSSRDGIGSDIHGNTEDTEFWRCKIDGGAAFGGNGTKYIDCEVSECISSGGYCYVSSEVVGGLFEVRGGSMRTYTNVRATGNAPITFSNQNAGIGAKYPCTVKITGLKSIAPNTTGGILTARAFETGNKTRTDATQVAAGAISLHVEDNDITDHTANVNGLMLLTSSATNWGAIHVGDNFGLPATQGFLDPSSIGITWSGVPYHFPKQTGSVTIAGTGSINAALLVTYKHPYPSGLTPAIGLSGPVKFSGSAGAFPNVQSPSHQNFNAALSSSDSGVTLPSSISDTYYWTAEACTF